MGTQAILLEQSEVETETETESDKFVSWLCCKTPPNAVIESPVCCTDSA